MKLNKDELNELGDTILRGCLIMFFALFIAVFIKAITMKCPLEEPEDTERLEAELDYYKAQTRYYELLAIDYEALLEGRGLLYGDE